MARLRAAWRARGVATFDAAMQAIAASLARIATMSEPLPDAGGVRARLRQAGAAIGIGSAEPGPAALAQDALARPLDDEVRANTRELLALARPRRQRRGRDPRARSPPATTCACASTRRRRRCGAAPSPARWSASRPTC